MIRRFMEMVFEQIHQPARLQTVPRLMISMLGVFIPPMRAVKETLYQSERPWVWTTANSPEHLGAGRPRTNSQSQRPSPGSKASQPSQLLTPEHRKGQ
jgi:hypothetical protein